MEFNRKSIDDSIDKIMEQARSQGASSEALFLIDAPLREYSVAIHQMMEQDAGVSDVCEASTVVVTSMIFHLASIIRFESQDEFVGFANQFMYETSQKINEAVNSMSNGKQYYIEALDPGRVQH